MLVVALIALLAPEILAVDPDGTEMRSLAPKTVALVPVAKATKELAYALATPVPAIVTLEVPSDFITTVSAFTVLELRCVDR